jgi:hypothetical protein
LTLIGLPVSPRSARIALAANSGSITAQPIEPRPPVAETAAAISIVPMPAIGNKTTPLEAPGIVSISDSYKDVLSRASACSGFFRADKRPLKA